MSIFWVFSLIISFIATFLISIFLIPFGSKIKIKISQALSRLHFPIIACLALHLILLSNEINSVKKNAHVKTNLYFTAEYFKAQRNALILLIGMSLLIGLLLISWQNIRWSTRNEQLRHTIAQRNEQNQNQH